MRAQKPDEEKASQNKEGQYARDCGVDNDDIVNTD